MSLKNKAKDAILMGFVLTAGYIAQRAGTEAGYIHYLNMGKEGKELIEKKIEADKIKDSAAQKSPFFQLNSY